MTPSIEHVSSSTLINGEVRCHNTTVRRLSMSASCSSTQLLNVSSIALCRPSLSKVRAFQLVQVATVERVSPSLAAACIRIRRPRATKYSSKGCGTLPESAYDYPSATSVLPISGGSTLGNRNKYLPYLLLSDCSPTLLTPAAVRSLLTFVFLIINPDIWTLRSSARASEAFLPLTRAAPRHKFPLAEPCFHQIYFLH